MSVMSRSRSAPGGFFVVVVARYLHQLTFAARLVQSHGFCLIRLSDKLLPPLRWNVVN